MNNPSDLPELLDLDEDIPELEDTSVSFHDLYSNLLQKKDIIVRIKKDDLQVLKDGMTRIKYDTGQKAIKAGFKPDARRLDYAIIEEHLEQDEISVRLWLKQRNGIKVLEMKETIRVM